MIGFSAVDSTCQYIHGLTIMNKLHHPWTFLTVSTDFSHTNNVIYGHSRTSSMMKFSKAKKKPFLYFLRSEKHCSWEKSYFWLVLHRTSIFQLLNLLSLLGKQFFHSLIFCVCISGHFLDLQRIRDLDKLRFCLGLNQFYVNSAPLLKILITQQSGQK